MFYEIWKQKIRKWNAIGPMLLKVQLTAWYLEVAASASIHLPRLHFMKSPGSILVGTRFCNPELSHIRGIWKSLFMATTNRIACTDELIQKMIPSSLVLLISFRMPSRSLDGITRCFRNRIFIDFLYRQFYCHPAIAVVLLSYQSVKYWLGGEGICIHPKCNLDIQIMQDIQFQNKPRNERRHIHTPTAPKWSLHRAT